MGQQQSSEKGERPEKPSRTSTPQSDKDKKGRRASVQVATGRASPAETSISNGSATSQTTAQPIPRSAVQRSFQTASPDTSSQTRVERSTSRGSTKGRKQELERLSEDVPPMPTAVPSGPVAVPSTSKAKDEYDDRSSVHHRAYTPVSVLRPPRLPLPIADAKIPAIPESPTLQPVDKGNEDVSILEEDASTEPLGLRRGSDLSTATQDDDEIGDELLPYAVDRSTSTEAVPTVIEYLQPCEKVYITGSFASWGRKYPLHKKKNGNGFAATLNLPPGTHHVTFIVDNSPPRISPDMPTTVDMHNFLVNYIEVIPDHVSRSRRESGHKSSRAVVYPAHPPLVAPEEEADSSDDELSDGYNEPEDLYAEEVPPGDFRQIIPQALLDMDLPEDDPRYTDAARVIQESHGPPGLPMFLGKSILNGNLPVKDDASVLTLPNHTVLNHLATSSVRNGVLATSVTTRYKKKVS